jgi:predicted MFS family arabinose efflux permease
MREVWLLVPIWLFGLLLMAFVFYTDDYVIAGVLPEIASELAVSEAAAGQLVTVFSITVAVVAPVAAVALARWPRRLVFLTALLVFVIANVGAALTPSFGVLLALRVIAAMATPALFAVAAKLASAGREGWFIGTVALGVTGSIAVGVPVGNWIGGHWEWRASFAIMAVGGAIAALWVMEFLPRTGAEPAIPLREQLSVLASQPIALGLLANALTITGSMMLLTYLAPYLVDLSGAGTEVQAIIFSTSGVAGIVEIWLGGLATDRWGPDRTLIAGIAAFVGMMAIFTLLWSLRPVPAWVVVPLALIWGGAAFWNSPAIQARLLQLAGPVGPQALGMNTSATYLGVAIGGALGGTLLSTIDASALPPASAALGLLALATFLLAAKAGRRLLAGAP